MTEALLELLPDSPVYHVGMYRNPGSNIPVQYYNRLPKGHPSDVALILDPIIASCENTSRLASVGSRFQSKTNQAVVMCAKALGCIYVTLLKKRVSRNSTQFGHVAAS